ncbi:MAG: MFS transporter [Candidatus Heimdallarchaeota archaeon]|nr:MFS transporter [Candidatus Heimdallarchaeota archaeon]
MLEGHEVKQKSNSVVKNRNFSSMFIGGFVSDMGTYFSIIAIIFLSIAKTEHLPTRESAQLVAFITVARIAPTLFFGPFAGVLVDRFDRKKIMILSDIFAGLTTLGFIFVTEISQMFVLAFLGSISTIFFYPARGASIPKIVEPDQLVQANGLIQTFTQISVLVGPGIAGLLIKQYGLEIAFIVDAVSFFVSALFILLIKADLKPVQNNGKLTIKSLTSDLRDGLVLVKNDPVISFILVLFAISLIGVGMINPLFAFYLKNEFGMDERDFGFILSFSAISGLITAIFITKRGQIKNKVAILVMGIYLVGLGMLLVGLAAYFDSRDLNFGYQGYSATVPSEVLLLYIGMAVIGSVNVVFNVPFSALMQAIVKNEDLGKISGFLGTILSLSQTVGALVATVLVLYYEINVIFIAIAIFLFLTASYFILDLKRKGISDIAYNREVEAIGKRQEELAKLKEMDDPVSDKLVAHGYYEGEITTSTF